jgi:hypothetical protein
MPFFRIKNLREGGILIGGSNRLGRSNSEGAMQHRRFREHEIEPHERDVLLNVTKPVNHDPSTQPAESSGDFIMESRIIDKLFWVKIPGRPSRYRCVPFRN